MEAELMALLLEANRIANHTPMPNRNDTCPCGSGKKYKRCHEVLDDAGEHGDELKDKEEL